MKYVREIDSNENPEVKYFEDMGKLVEELKNEQVCIKNIQTKEN